MRTRSATARAATTASDETQSAVSAQKGRRTDSGAAPLLRVGEASAQLKASIFVTLTEIDLPLGAS